MSDQRIYHALPRLLGSLRHWSGKDCANGVSWLIEQAVDRGFNAIWLSPFMTTTQVEKDRHGSKLTGSLYSIRDHFMLDPEFSSGGYSDHGVLSDKEQKRIALMDKEHLQHFCFKASEKGVRVYADLVFNHVAADHPLVLEEKKRIEDISRLCGGNFGIVRADNGKIIGMSYLEEGVKKTFNFKFRRNEDLTLQIGGPVQDPWSDVAQINFSSPEARRFFVTGDGDKEGYFKKIIDWYLERGFSGFRCDVAYKVPPEVWQEIISYAHGKQDDIKFLAETLGGDEGKIKRLSKAVIKNADGKSRPAFDYGMLGFYWWDGEQGWLPENEHALVSGMSRLGGAAAPDTHDTEMTLAESFYKTGLKKEDVEKICMRDYAISALCVNSFFMQMGYEYGNKKQTSVFKNGGGVADWDYLKKHAGFDLSSRIKAVNDLKEKLDVGNCIAHFVEYGVTENERILRLKIQYKDVDTGMKKAEVTLVVNKSPEKGIVFLSAAEMKLLEKSGLQKSAFDAPRTEGVADVLIYHTPFKDAPKHAPPAAQSRGKKFGA